MELRLCWIFRFFLTSILIKCAFTVNVIQLRKEQVREFSHGKLYYRTLFLDTDRDVLYVGAMDSIFMLNLADVNHTTRKKVRLNLPPGNANTCLIKGKSEHFDCHNHIKVIQPMTKDWLYICGTNAFSPRDLVITKKLIVLPQLRTPPGIGNGIGKCSFDPADNSTAVWAKGENPGDFASLYNGGTINFGRNDAAITRPDIYHMKSGKKSHAFVRSTISNHEWLNKPDFAGSFVIGEYVYFFFKENAIEDQNPEMIYSRVARVCRGDKGDKMNTWTTFSKARLICSRPGKVPLYFNEIQSIYKSPDDDTHFYGTFSSSTNSSLGSAICLYHIDDIQEAFNGNFKELSRKNNTWLPVSSNGLPGPRPGSCTSEHIPFSTMNFIKYHPLMDSTVSAKNGGSVFSQSDILLTKLVIDELRIDFAESNLEYTVYYAGTNNGEVYRIVSWIESNGKPFSNVDVFKVTHGEPIQAIAISEDHSSLYVTSDYRIVQVYLVMCSIQYDDCYRCARDPYCGWNKETNSCEPYAPGLIQNVPGNCSGPNHPKEICECVEDDWKLTAKKKKCTHGNCLTCVFQDPQVQNNPILTWYHNSSKKGRLLLSHKNNDAIDKFYENVNKRDLLFDVISVRSKGVYECLYGNTRMCKFTVGGEDATK